MTTETKSKTKSQPQTADDLHDILQKTFDLYRRTHLAHWNVRGPHFSHLHAFFEEQYKEMWEALDVIAERIRAIGRPVQAGALNGKVSDPGSDARHLVAELAQGHRELAAHLRDMEAHAAAAGDPGTADLATERVRAHDQHAWMLEATLEGWK